MAAGIVIARASFDQSIGNLANAIDQTLQQWNALNGYIVGVGGGFSGLMAAPLSYTDSPSGSGDATRVFAGAADMAQLYSIYTGAATLGSTKDFRANIKFLSGTSVH